MLGVWRRPPTEPLTPGLRRISEMTNAIGFTANIISHDQDDY